MRVLLLNLNSETNGLVNGALAGQGYEITTESALTVDEVLALSPEVLRASRKSPGRPCARTWRAKTSSQP